MKLFSYYAWMALSVILFLGGCSHSSYLESSGSPVGLSSEDLDTDLETKPQKGESSDSQTEVHSEKESTIFIQVAGAVKNPGVYELKQQARVFEAIDAAGGLKRKADGDSLNLASVLSDGEKIYVNRRGHKDKEGAAKEEDGTMVQTESLAGVNINTADMGTLQTLSGIGEVKAKAIISYREKNGGFKSIDELKQVDGIGETTFQRLKDEITV